jgi:beta-N-acetylhexosaminidase
MTVRVTTGLEVLLDEGHSLVDGKRIGLITNHTAIDRTLRSAIDLLHNDPRFELVHLYGPEHGVRGDAQAGDKVGAERDPETGLPVDSLYGATRKPTPEMLEGIDVLLFDIQDGGARFYTYISTMALAMESANEAGIPFVVLDRPNPISGNHIEGPILDPQYESFVGIHPIATRHGLTMGELAHLFAADRGWPEPQVIRMRGWTREMWFDDTGLSFVQASPNLPTLDSLTVYTGTCIFEATTLSEGRGTTRPFEYIGAPWVNAVELVADLRSRDLPGVGFRPASFVPMFSKHQGETCHGLQLHVFDREAFRPVEVGVHLVHAMKHLTDSQFGWRSGSALGMSANLLYGTDDLHTMIDAGAGPEEIIAKWDEGQAEYREKAAAAYLY